MHKKKNIKFKIITGASAAGAVIVISVAVIIVLGQSKSQKYGVHLESANQYLVKEDYAEAEKEYLQMSRSVRRKQKLSGTVSMYTKRKIMTVPMISQVRDTRKQKILFWKPCLRGLKSRSRKKAKMTV